MKVKVIEVKFIKVKELLRENRNLRASLEQSEIEICRHKAMSILCGKNL